MVRHKADLFVGVTSWNSALFLGVCLQSLRETTKHLNLQLFVFDNDSSDGSPDIARKFGATVISGVVKQGDALNKLVDLSRAEFTLLVHADVVFLNQQWFEKVSSELIEPLVLISPEDIGCGPLTRSFGVGYPESSFLLFRTKALRSLKRFSVRFRGVVPELSRKVDFYGPHVTHHLPSQLALNGYEWKAMQVHPSDSVKAPIYQPDFKPGVWDEKLAYLRYGLGNFYSINGQVTHYHNWYDRVPKSVHPDSREETGKSGGFPLAYISAYSQAFLRDYRSGAVTIPNANLAPTQPRAL